MRYYTSMQVLNPDIGRQTEKALFNCIAASFSFHLSDILCRHYLISRACSDEKK